MRKLVSVVMPTRNRPELFARSLHSILAQTYKEIEVVVVDGSDDDATARILRNFHDHRVKYLREDKSTRGTGIGLPCAKNFGIAHSSGDYLTFQDDDVVAFPRKIETLVQIIESCDQDTGAVYSAYMRKTSDGKTLDVLPPWWVFPKSGNIFRTLCLLNSIDANSILLRIEVIWEVGQFEQKIPLSEDWELALRIARRYKVAYCSTPLYDYFVTPSERNELQMYQATRGFINRNLDLDSSARFYFWLGGLVAGLRNVKAAVKR